MKFHSEAESDTLFSNLEANFGEANYFSLEMECVIMKKTFIKRLDFIVYWSGFIYLRVHASFLIKSIT